MAQNNNNNSNSNAHVPKFGDWESEDIAYTACFEHARQVQSSGGGKIINPNDPEDNPEAFAAIMNNIMMIRNNNTSESDHRVNVIVPDYDHDHDHHDAPSRRSVHRTDPNRPTSAEKRHRRGHHGHRGSINHRYDITDNDDGNLSADQRSSSDLSLLKKRQSDSHDHRRVKGDDQRRNNNKSYGSSAHGNQSSSSGSEQWRRRNGRGTVANYPSDHLDHQISHQRAASIPKFGSWDVNDPKTGEGFTIIFNQVKEERHINSSTKLPPMPPTPPPQPKQKTFSCLSKICCCFFSS